MLKKLIIILTIVIFSTTTGYCATSNANLVRLGVNKYKAQNFSGCICTMKEVAKQDPSNAMAQYYIAISYARLGDKTEALNYYKKVVALNSNATLTAYSKLGIDAINKSDFKYAKENKSADQFVNAGYTSGVHPDVNKKLKEIELEKTKNDINKRLNAPAVTTRQSATDAPSKQGEETPKEEQNANQTSMNSQPTDAEIAHAVKVLAAAGINPLQLATPQNPVMPNQTTMNSQAMQQYSQSATELAQLQMMLGNQNNNNNYNNNMMNFLPYLMQNGQKNPAMSKEYLQTMMMTQMMPDFTFNTSQN